MLWTICVVLIVLWLLGVVTGTTMGGLVHALLVIAIIVVLVLRSVVRRAGAPVINSHWPGTDGGLAALARLTGLQLR